MRSFKRASTPQLGQPTGRGNVSMVSTSPAVDVSRSTIATSSNPTNCTQRAQDLSSEDTGVLLSVGFENLQTGEPPCSVQGWDFPLVREEPTMLLTCPSVGTHRHLLQSGDKNAHRHWSYSKNPPCGSNGNSWSWPHTAVGHRCFCSDIYNLGGEQPIRSCRKPLNQHRLLREHWCQLGVGYRWLVQHRHRYGLGGEWS